MGLGVVLRDTSALELATSRLPVNLHPTFYILTQYPRDNVQNARHYQDMSPDRAKLKGLILDNDRRRSVHYPAYYTATIKTKK